MRLNTALLAVLYNNVEISKKTIQVVLSRKTDLSLINYDSIIIIYLYIICYMLNI